MSSRLDERQKKKKTWEELVLEQVTLKKLNGATCAVYTHNSTETIDGNRVCVCGRLARRHSFIGTPKTRFRTAVKWLSKLAEISDVTVYGQLKNGARFIRCDTDNKPFHTLVRMLVDDVGASPRLLVSCYGGAQYFTMTDELEREFMSGIGHLASTPDVWILTTGLNSGVSNLIGQGIHRSTLLDGSKWKPVAVGMSRWGTIDERTREMLKKQTSNSFLLLPHKPVLLDENEPQTMDHHHSHFLLLDDGCLTNYLDDRPRSDFVAAARKETNCYAVTIIVEGGVNTLAVIHSDLHAERPVVIVHGSGRLATLLGDLLEGVGKTETISLDDIHRQLKLWPVLGSSNESKQKEVASQIEIILDLKYRKYLSVFRLGRDANLMNTIFGAVFDCQSDGQDSLALLKLAVDWNCVDGAHDVFKRTRIANDAALENTTKNKDRVHYPHLFEEALRKNRPQFVDYFLRRYWNPLETTKYLTYKERIGSSQELANDSIDKDRMCTAYAFRFIINTLYRNEGAALTDGPYPRPTKMEDLDKMYFKLIGPYAESFYEEKSILDIVRTALLKICRRPGRVYPGKKSTKIDDEMSGAGDTSPRQPAVQQVQIPSNWTKPFGKQEMLRDIFLWSVYENHSDIASVLLLQIKSRICAALVGAGIAHRLSLKSKNPHIRDMYKKHRKALEEYASACIDDCYKRNERTACQLLLRQISLFGNITCMQVAIATRSIPFINTHCFNRVLNRQWYDHLDITSIENAWGICKFTVHIVTFGIAAPYSLQYRESEKMDEQMRHYQRTFNEKKHEGQTSDADTKISSELVDIDVQYQEKDNYRHRLMQFHTCPVVMIAYDFIFYIWFLLVFSYFMLFGMRSSNDPVHWTEIYVIITVSAALLEEIRQHGVEVQTRMLERWHTKDMGMVIIYVIPYVLFYIGMGLHFSSKARPNLFATARIVLAIDLEIWYLFSLRFVSAIKLLGPKLFMIRNMMRDLVSLLYVIFVCIAAYGVVSRALTMYSTLEFTAYSVATSVFYRPYWFLYSIVDDEKENLDNIISSNNSSTDEVAEATVTHVLLAFHMLFINILLLSLLIAMLNFSIDNVQALSKYFWRYQRYELVREYYEKPMLTFPPLSLLVYVGMLVRLSVRRFHTRYRIFKHVATPAFDAYWTDFEHAATYNHARGLVEEKYRPRSREEPKKPIVQSADKQASQAPISTAAATEEIQTQAATSETQTSTATIEPQVHAAISELQAQATKLMEGMEWMMKAIERVKMSSKKLPRPALQPTTDSYTSEA